MTDLLSPASLRLDFPVMARQLYLDAAHQTPLPTSVRTALDDFYAQANEMAGPKPDWLRRVEEIRAEAAAFLGASVDEIAFTKNTSEGLNIIANALPLSSGENVLMIEGDHPNNAYTWLNLARKGIEVRSVKLESDAVIADADTFAPYIDGRTRAISMSHVTFHAGQVHDLASIGKLCAKHGLYFVVDAMQSVGVMPLDVKALGISLLAAGCHKGLYTPQGLGILYVQRTLDDLRPAYLAMDGLAHPPADYIARPDDLTLKPGARRFELGNLNLAGIHALSAALSLMRRADVPTVLEHVRTLGDRLIAHLDALGISLIGPRTRSHRAHIYVLDISMTEWGPYFAEHHVRVSPERGGIRVSFGLFNTIEDVDRLADLIHRRIGGTAASDQHTAAIAPVHR